VTKETPKIEERAPIIAVMGHIDHGKSKLLDYIRKTNVVDGEAGGITQHLSAYEVEIKNKDGDLKKITFLDTPGHAAFSKMRSRGANVADIAILVVSAEEGIKTQTLEALRSIKEAEIPYIVAITKIDKSEANVEKVKNNLLEKEIYLEGLGGDVPYVPLSSITGEGVDELLEMILLVAEVEELTGDRNKKASGIIIEADLDPKRGISATLVIKDGTLLSGEYIAAGKSVSPVRIFENFKGEQIKEASFSSPVRIVGWSEIPKVGNEFNAFSSKNEAEKVAQDFTETNLNKKIVIDGDVSEDTLILPIIIRADTEGTAEAVREEIEKIEAEKVILKIIFSGTGNITEADLKISGADENAVIVGFNVKAQNSLVTSAEKLGMRIKTFDIIYKLVEWVEELVEERRPRQEVEEERGEAKILAVFSKTKNHMVIGGEVKEGTISKGEKFKIVRRNEEIGTGKIIELQSNKQNSPSVNKGAQFGANVSYSTEIAENDRLKTFEIVKK